MMRYRWVAWVLLGLAANSASAENLANTLVEKMKHVRQSDGFEMRMNVTVIPPDGHRKPPLKLIVIGQVNGEQRRLLIRTTALELVGKRYVEAGQRTNGEVRVVGYDAPDRDKPESLGDQDRLYNTGLRAWDMFESWWDWPKQALGSSEQIAGRECTKVHSRPGSGRGAVGEVVNCINQEGQLALRTEIYDGHHDLLRAIQVEKMIRMDNGAMTAKKLLITEADQTVTEVDIYGGDEHYAIEAGTFSRIDASMANGKTKKK